MTLASPGMAGALRQELTGLLTPGPRSRRSDCMIWNAVVMVNTSMSAAAITGS
jgi:hypothetical protein